MSDRTAYDRRMGRTRSAWAEREARNALIRGSTDSVSVLARRLGMTRPAVSRIRASAPRPPRTRRQQFEALLDSGWVAACMTADEWAHWIATNPLALTDKSIAERPCRDCPLAFATEMRAEGHCNGTPGWRPPAVEELEEGSVDSIVAARIADTASVAP